MSGISALMSLRVGERESGLSLSAFCHASAVCSPENSPHRNLTMLSPWMWTCSLQNCVRQTYVVSKPPSLCLLLLSSPNRLRQKSVKTWESKKHLKEAVFNLGLEPWVAFYRQRRGLKVSLEDKLVRQHQERSGHGVSLLKSHGLALKHHCEYRMGHFFFF